MMGQQSLSITNASLASDVQGGPQKLASAASEICVIEENQTFGIT